MLDKIAQIKGKIEKFSNLQKASLKFGDFLEFYEQLEITKDTINSYISIQAILHEHNNKVFKKENFSLELDQIKDILDHISTVNYTSPPKISQIEGIESRFKRAYQGLKDKWTTYINNQTKEVIFILGVFSKFSQSSAKTGELLNIINVLSMKWPISEKEITKLLASLDDAKKIINDLKIEDNIKDFLIALAANNAKLSQITPEILEWLNKNHFSDNLRIIT